MARLAPAHRDGLALVLSSGLTSVVGLLYWVIAARLFPPAVLGVNQVALNTMMLLGSVAHLNMTYALLRFVPVAGLAARRLVALGYLAAITFAALVGGVFALGAEIWAPELVEGLGYGRLVAFFLIATPVWSLFVIQDFVLTAVKKATAVPVENAVFSVLKIALLVVAFVGAVPGGIAISWVVSTAAVVLAINAWLLLKVLPAHGRATVASATPITLGGFTRFIRADYAGAALWQCALFGLPLLVLARLEAESAAVYGIVWTISQALYTVSSGMGQSMVAHSASDLAGLEKARKAMVRRAMMLVVPVAAVVSVGAPLWLLVFGEHYAANGSMALILASLSAIPNVITASTVNAARVRQRMGVLFGVPATLALAVIIGSWALMPHLGITGVGLSWLVAQTLMAIGILIATAPWLPPLLSTRIDAVRSAALVRRVRPLAHEHNASSPEEWGLGDLIAGKSDSIVIDFKNLSGGTGALLKAADSVAGRSQLLRQTEVLDRLHADTRLGGWRALIPTIERAGHVGGSYCIVESRLPGERGVGALYDLTRTRRFRSSAIATISEFHRLTSTPVVAGDAQLIRWIHEPMAEVVGALPKAHRPAALALADQLAEHVRGAVVATGWAHGDYTPDNVLTDQAGQVIAVVDWCQADELGMPLMDVSGFHLVSTFMVTSGAELGATVLNRLTDIRPDDHQLFARTQRMLGSDVLDSRVVMVLGWLMHVAHNIEKSPQFAANPLWVRRNLVTVVQGAPELLSRPVRPTPRHRPRQRVLVPPTNGRVSR
ncbi:phosphotransferase [Pseudonocardia humida]|uniref:Phosphotransferase n=1 Tax=Pseudonocardia humida TaxID=2800819 RepID=A0ABT1A7X8_9PSEU|nr:phosphotransferase [Pseudonocardia humida]MCO1659127.1 phosphotransferase [Pseudonocardia humida]